MAQLVGLIVSEDDKFRKQMGKLLRSASVPVSVLEDRAQRETTPDVVIADIRGDAQSAMAGIERLRAASPGAGIFAIALSAEPDLILQSMRAAPTEFFTSPPPQQPFQTPIPPTAPHP